MIVPVQRGANLGWGKQGGDEREYHHYPALLLPWPCALLKKTFKNHLFCDYADGCLRSDVVTNSRLNLGDGEDVVRVLIQALTNAGVCLGNTNRSATALLIAFDC